MKKLFLLTIISIFALSLAVQAQIDDSNYYSRNLDNYARDLKRYSVDLVDATERDLRRGRRNNSRAEVQNAFRARQLDASAGLLQQMISDNRPADELRYATSAISDLLRGAPNYGLGGNLWRSAANSLNDINRELGGGNFGGGRDNDRDRDRGRDRNSSGSVVWRGVVDNRIQLEISGRRITQRTTAGKTYPNGTYNFTSSLPRGNVNIDVDKKDGRGKVRVLQRPDRSNNYTAVIEIEDDDGGADNYQLEIFWN